MLLVSNSGVLECCLFIYLFIFALEYCGSSQHSAGAQKLHSLECPLEAACRTTKNNKHTLSCLVRYYTFALILLFMFLLLLRYLNFLSSNVQAFVTVNPATSCFHLCLTVTSCLKVWVSYHHCHVLITFVSLFKNKIQ